jgi:hypothetical protein
VCVRDTWILARFSIQDKHVNKKGQQENRIFGDGIFKNIALEQNAIRSYHQPTHNVALTEMQTHENTVMKKMRIRLSAHTLN